jgi:hypothetical protein
MTALIRAVRAVRAVSARTVRAVPPPAVPPPASPPVPPPAVPPPADTHSTASGEVESVSASGAASPPPSVAAVPPPEASVEVESEEAYSKTPQGRNALETAKNNLETAKNNLDMLTFTELPTTQHAKVFDYWFSSLKAGSFLGIMGHVIGLLFTLLLSPFWLTAVTLYNLTSTSNNTLQNQTKPAINPDDLDTWMRNIITNIDSIESLHSQTKNNILNELNSLKDQIDRQKSGWLVKKANGDNYHYVEKSTVLNSIGNINSMIEYLLPTTTGDKIVEKAKKLLEKLNGGPELDQDSAINDYREIINDYREIMNNDGVWAGELEISAFANLFNCKVDIIKQNEKHNRIQPIAPTPMLADTKEIKVYYTGVHYNAHKATDTGAENILTVPGDGNCLFRALLESANSACIKLEGFDHELTQTNHLALRNHILQKGIDFVDKSLLPDCLKVAMNAIIKQNP